MSNSEISSITLNLLQNFYREANACMKLYDKCTDFVNIEKDVLQGDTASPILFSLFLSNLVMFLIDPGGHDIMVDRTHKTIILAFAENIAL